MKESSAVGETRGTRGKLPSEHRSTGEELPGSAAISCRVDIQCFSSDNSNEIFVMGHLMGGNRCSTIIRCAHLSQRGPCQHDSWWSTDPVSPSALTFHLRKVNASAAKKKGSVCERCETFASRAYPSIMRDSILFGGYALPHSKTGKQTEMLGVPCSPSTG